MPCESISVWFLDIQSASSSIEGGTGSDLDYFRIYIVSSNSVMSEI